MSINHFVPLKILMVFAVVLCMATSAFAVPTISMTPTSGSDTTGTTVYNFNAGDISALSSNDGLKYTVKGYWPTAYDQNVYLKFLFNCEKNYIPLCAVVDSSTLYFDWAERCYINASHIRVYDYDAENWVTYDLTNPPLQNTDTTAVIDLFANSKITTPEDLNNLDVRFEAKWNNANEGRTYHDLVRVDATYNIPECNAYLNSGECTEFNSETGCPSCEWCEDCNGKLYSGGSDRCLDSGYCNYQCDDEQCGAECDDNEDCQPKCVDDTYYYDGSCSKGCECSYTSQDCNEKDGWKNSDKYQWIDYDQCNEKEQVWQDYYDWSCGEQGCDYEITDGKWVDTGEYRSKGEISCDDGLWCTVNDYCKVLEDDQRLLTVTSELAVCVGGQNMDCSDRITCTDDTCDETNDRCNNVPNNANCDNDLYCDGQETCQPCNENADEETGCVEGTIIDCSPYSYGEIATCENDPDANPFTWDYSAAFESVCDEKSDSCTQQEREYTHVCDVLECNAECDEKNGCNPFIDEDDYCYYNGMCEGDCSCSYDSDEYCPEAGTEDDGYCYYTNENDCQEDCSEEGCNLVSAEMGCYDECDSCEGPKDTTGPVVTDLALHRTCKSFDLSGIANDCTSVEQAQYDVDTCPGADQGSEMSASDGAFGEDSEDIYANGIDLSGYDSGSHTIYVNGEDDEGNWGTCGSIGFCMDNAAPVVEKTYGTPFFEEMVPTGTVMEIAGKHYITSETPITLTTSDPTNCTAESLTGTYYNYSLLYTGNDISALFDVTNWITYTTPFTIQGPDGVYQICFYAEDNYCNKYDHCQEVILDNQPPETTKTIVGLCECGENDCITSAANFTFSAVDYPVYNSGVDATYYRWCEYNPEEEMEDFQVEDDECEYSCEGSWNEYTGSQFSITGEDGMYYVEYYSVDNLGNTEEKKCEYDLLNNTPTEVVIQATGFAHANDFNVTVTDTTHCLENAECSYRIYNGENCGEWTDWMERQCNSNTLVDVGGCCDEADDDCRCGVKNMIFEAKIVDCYGAEFVASKTYTIDFVNPPAGIYGPSGKQTGPLVNLTVDTNKAALCKFDTNSFMTFDSMANTFNTADGYHHYFQLDLEDGYYTYYFLCRDELNNTMPWASIIAFEIDHEYTPPTPTTTTSSTTTIVPSTTVAQFSTSGSGGGGYSGGGSSCTTNWTCTNWSSCVNGNQNRTCTKINSACTAPARPIEKRTCTIEPVATTTTSETMQMLSASTTPESNGATETTTTTIEPSGSGSTTNTVTGMITSVTQDPVPALGLLSALGAIALILLL